MSIVLNNPTQEWKITYKEGSETKIDTVELKYARALQVERWFSKRNKGNKDITLISVDAVR